VSDYWIIENPSSLIIYDNYEQRLTENAKNLLAKFSAWRIVDPNHTLSDQFTNTIKTEHNQKVYFIQVSSDGELINGSLAGQTNIFRKAKIQGDTLRVARSNRISLQHGDSLITLSEGVLIQRIFVYRNRTFARDIASNISGWIKGNGPANWEAYLPKNSDLVLEQQIFSRINHIFNSYNARLDKLFTFLNKLYNKSKISPQWQSEKTPTYLKYTIGPTEYMNQFSDSQAFLVQELHDLLYGSFYQLSSVDGQIIIIKSSSR